jgi:DNA polymerase III delta prime subunit
MKDYIMSENFLWVEKFRPRTVDETILPDDLKKTFNQFIEQKNIPNLILTGGAGVGKTTVARAMLEELGADYIMINASLNGNIDTLRNEIKNFASTVSFAGGRKYVILDEADYLTPAVQGALRSFMEEYSKNCGFIMTCNFKNRIIEPLHSRCSVIEFNFGKKDIAKLASKFLTRVCTILDSESVSYDKAAVAEFIMKYYPDWRRVLNELQRYSAAGDIDSGILVNLSDDSFNSLVEFMKVKNFVSVRKWVAENSDIDSSTIFRKFYDLSSSLMTPRSIPHVVLHIAKYQYQAAFVVDTEINTAACLLEIMHDVEFI